MDRKEDHELREAFVAAFGEDALERLRTAAEKAVEQASRFVEAIVEATARAKAEKILAGFLPEKVAGFIAWHIPACLLPAVDATVLIEIDEGDFVGLRVLGEDAEDDVEDGYNFSPN